MREKVRIWWPAVTWMTISFATSCTLITSRQLVKTVTTRGPVHMRQEHFQSFWDSWWWLFVKGYHVLEFAMLTLLLLRPLRGRIWQAGAFALLYAASDEYHQTFVPWRGGRWTDVLIDSIGIGFVCAIAFIFRRSGSHRSGTISDR